MGQKATNLQDKTGKAGESQAKQDAQPKGKARASATLDASGRPWGDKEHKELVDDVARITGVTNGAAAQQVADLVGLGMNEQEQLGLARAILGFDSGNPEHADMGPQALDELESYDDDILNFLD